jgi:hypothetical protein
MWPPVIELALGDWRVHAHRDDALPRTYDAKFRRRVLEVVRAGWSVRVAAAA